MEKRVKPAAKRLPRGRHGLPPEMVRRNQRQRILAGFAQVVAEYGYAKATISRISEAAAVSRNTFYEQFDDKESCFVAAYAEVSDHVRQTVCAAVEGHEEWTERVTAAIAAVVAFFAASPDLARLCMVEAVAAGPPVAARHREAIDFYAEQLHDAQPEPAEERPPGTTERVLVSGAATLIARRLNEGRDDQLPGLLPDLVEIILAPYVGESEAARLASRASA